MTALTRLDRFDDLFNEFFRRMPARTSRLAELPDDIRVDLSENDKEYLVTAEIPGAKKDDIRVTVDGNFVSISAEIRKEFEDQHADKGRSLLKETYRGAIQRAFTLDHDVDDQAATAKLEDGVLHLTLPKRARPGSRQLSIQ